MFFRLTFPLFYACIYALSSLPWGFWYGVSNLLYGVLFHLLKYRRAVAYQNLKRCFPDKSETEIAALMQETYRHLCDTLVEFFKEISMSEAELKRRMVIKNPEIFTQIEAKGKSVIFLATHYGNFEWMTTRTTTATRFNCLGVYAPLSSRYFEELAQQTRRRWGGELVPAKNALQNLKKRLHEEVIIGFITDQTPSRARKLYFTRFFGQTTAVHDKFAHFALQNEIDLYFVDVRKPKRGYYTMEVLPLFTENYLPYSEANAYRLTDDYIQRLERIISEQPAYWLWTHRRWKHEPQEQDMLSARLSD